MKTSWVSNHLRIPILVLKVGITKFLYLEYKTTNNPSIKETQMQPLFFVYIFVRTQKRYVKGNYENRLACWQVIQVAYRMFIRFTLLFVFIHVPDTTNTCLYLAESGLKKIHINSIMNNLSVLEITYTI